MTASDALEQMQSGAVEAADTLASACPKNVPAALPARLDSVAQVTEAFMAALDGVRPATEAFYSSLNDEQKARLVALYMSNNDAQRPPAPSQRSSRNDRRFPDVSTTQQKSICEQWAGALRDWPIRQIETSIPLSDIQHAALYDLTASVHRGAAALTTSCPTEMSFTPLGQIDAKRRRIDALRQAVNIIRPVLERFASSLNDDQKMRLNETVNSTRPAPPRRRQNDDD
jgi:hypothetical protein